MAIRIVYVLYNFGRIEQDHNVVRQKADSTDAELFFREQGRTGFGHAKGRTHNRNVDTAGVDQRAKSSGLVLPVYSGTAEQIVFASGNRSFRNLSNQPEDR